MQLRIIHALFEPFLAEEAHGMCVSHGSKNVIASAAKQSSSATQQCDEIASLRS
jgi:hypothetical protein